MIMIILSLLKLKKCDSLYVHIFFVFKPKILFSGLNIWWPNHKYKTIIFGLTFILKVLVGIICLHQKNDLSLKSDYIFVVLFVNKIHIKNSK
jgi:hypothetical protein